MIPSTLTASAAESWPPRISVHRKIMLSDLAPPFACLHVANVKRQLTIVDGHVVMEIFLK